MPYSTIQRASIIEHYFASSLYGTVRNRFTNTFPDYQPNKSTTLFIRERINILYITFFFGTRPDFISPDTQMQATIEFGPLKALGHVVKRVLIQGK